MDSKNFQKLTPINDADIEIYEEAIDFVFDNSDITNVAISGPYSAGKSSVLESYKEKHKKLKFLHISLAHFESLEENQDKDNVKESVLEGKILNQLIHQIPVKGIPQTNFRVKRNTGISKIIRVSILLYMLFGSIAYLTFLNKINVYVKELQDIRLKKALTVLTGEYSSIVAVLLFVIACIISIYCIVRVQENKNLFHKVSVQGNTIEIFEKQEDSYFDKYLNEVLYLFDRVNVDVIVFEDIDRFNGNGIFERLREVNKLTNIQRKNDSANKKISKLFKRVMRKNIYKPLRFFYLLRDDLFITKDRTKFFDYIVPVVPVLDGSNSYEQFVKHLKKGNIFDKFDNSFLQRLSLYIDDMRVLKNVFNEFIIYIHRLDNTDLNWNKMLAMIVYKNLFPKDFSALHLAKGYVHELFSQKEKIGKDAVKKLQRKKESVNAKIDIINREVSDSLQELEDIFKAKINRLPTVYSYNTAEQQRRRKQEQELEEEKQIRKKAIEDRRGILKEYEKEIKDIEYEITHIKSMLLNELINRNNAEEVFMISSINPVGDEDDYREIKANSYFDLLKFLIRYGYIDETYNDYMTYFYEESLTAHDKSFLRRITDKRGADYDYKLKDVQKVIASPILREVDFSEEETLNFELLNGLVKNHATPKYQRYLVVLIEQIKSKKQMDFLAKYFDSDIFLNEFIEILNEQWPECFSYIVKNKALSSEQIRRFSVDTLCLGNEQVLDQVNFDSSLRDYISAQSDYLDIKNPDVEKIISQFHVLHVSFKNIIFEKSNKTLFDRVYEDNLYDLTFENIELMLKTQYGITKSAEIKQKNYSLIKSETESSLASYIEENMQSYLEEILNKCEENILDDETDVLAILNNTSVEEDIKKQYISRLKTLIYDITKVEDVELWKLLYGKQIVEISVFNVVHYFQVHNLDDILVQFVNNMDLNSDFLEIENFGAETAENFFDAVVINNDVETKRYEKILNTLGYIYTKYDVEIIADDKMKVLMKNRIIEMNVESLKYVRNNYETHLMFFIEKNLEAYLSLLTSDVFVYDEAIRVLDMDFEDDKKIEMLKNTKEAISVVNKEYSDKLKAYIIGNNFDEKDAEYLFQNYSKYSELMRDAIYEVAVKRIDDISKLDDLLLSDIIQKSTYGTHVKIRLWAKMLPYLNEHHFTALSMISK